MELNNNNVNISTHKLYKGDCLEIMKGIPNESVDMILCDLPYGTTACKWDSIIPLNMLWKQYNRIIKDNGAIVLTASQPFTTELINSNKKNFKYTWVWEKSHSANFAVAKYVPLKRHEDIVVFYSKKPTYNPQMTIGEYQNKRIGKKLYDREKDTYLTNKPAVLENVKNNTYYPTTILKFNCVSRNKSIHPTQKPVELLEYLIKTYTNEGETVLDNTMGSGSTGEACLRTNRNFIGIEQDDKYFEIAKNRIENTYNENKAMKSSF